MNRSAAPLARAAALAACLCAAATLGGCVAYPYYPYPAPAYAGPSTFERAYDAALGALAEQGLTITSQDRASGNIVGSRGAYSIAASVRPQADGTTRVAFTPRGEQAPQDAGLVDRVFNAYNVRMAR